MTRCPQCGHWLRCVCEQASSRIEGLYHFKNVERFDPDMKELAKTMADINEVLYARLADKRREGDPMALRIVVLGIEEISSKPWIIFLCPEYLSEEAKLFFGEGFARRRLKQTQVSYPVEVAIVDELNFRSGGDVEVAWVQSDHQVSNPSSSQIAFNGTSLATMGGLLVLEGNDGLLELSGLTVGHLLPRGDTISRSSVTHNIDQVAPDIGSTSLENRTKDSEEGPFGRVHEVSSSIDAINRDWALIKFVRGEQVSNFFNQCSRYSQNEVFSLGACKGPATVCSAAHPPLQAMISTLPAIAVLPSGRRFVPIYPVTIDGSQATKLPDGTSGSWIVTEASTCGSGEIVVHGMFVADDDYGDIYTIPMTDILRDVQNCLDVKSVRLPHSTDEIISLSELYALSSNRKPSHDATEGEGASTTTMTDLAAERPVFREPTLQADDLLVNDSSMQPPQSVRNDVPKDSSSHSSASSPIRIGENQDGSSHQPLDIGTKIPEQEPAPSWKPASNKVSVWICSECRTGNMGTWFNVCPDCEHVRCERCETAEV